MLGGTSFDLGGHGSNEPIWRIDAVTSKWENTGIDLCLLSTPRHLMSSHAVVTPDEQNVIIVEKEWIQVLDIRDQNDYKIRRTIMLSGELGDIYWKQAVVMQHQQTNGILVISFWFRKSFSAEQRRKVVCPMAILKLMCQFVCQEMLHLIAEKYRYDLFKHWAIPLSNILSPDGTGKLRVHELPGFEMQDFRNLR